MKSNIISFIFSLHKSVIVVLIATMFAFPTLSMFSTLNDLNTNFIELHDEKDTNEKENLEENSKNEKKELQLSNLDFGSIFSLTCIKNYAFNNLLRDFILEIPIPPPDMA